MSDVYKLKEELARLTLEYAGFVSTSNKEARALYYKIEMLTRSIEAIRFIHESIEFTERFRYLESSLSIDCNGIFDQCTKCKKAGIEIGLNKEKT